MSETFERTVDPKTGIGNWIPQDVIEEAEWIVNHLCLEDADNVKAIKSVLRVRLHGRQEDARNAGIEASAKVLDRLMYDYGCCAGVDAAEMASFMAKIAADIRQMKAELP